MKLFLLLTPFIFALSAHAQVGVVVADATGNAPRVDGMLRDWRGMRRVQVGEGPDASMRFALAHDGAGLYVSASVLDERLVRTGRPSGTQDAVVISLAVPRRGRFTTQEIWLHPGVTGEAASASRRSRRRFTPIRGARVVERRTRGGYDLEAFVPLSGSWRQGRLWLRLNDVDTEARGEVENSPASADVDPGDPDSWPRISGGGSGALARFLRAQNMVGTEPRRTLRADVAGDAQQETLAQVGRFVVVYGAAYRGGDGFDFLQLPVRSEADVRSLELRDLTGDGKAELIARLRQQNAAGSRDLWQTFFFDGESVRAGFAIELRKETNEGSVESTLRIRGRRTPTIEVRAGRARGLDASNLREQAAGDAVAILLPWGPVRSRTYRWDGSRFSVVRERANPRAARAQAQTRAAETQPEPREEPPPRIAALLRAAKRAASIRGRAVFTRDVNLAGDRSPERIALFGNDLLVVGPSFRGGDGYFHYAIPADAGEVEEIRVADLNGDGRAEVMVFARQEMGDVTRQVLLVHRFTRDGSFPRVLMAEVGRAQGARSIRNEVRTRGGALVIAPGRARGWTADTWPWSRNEDPNNHEVLLPWRDSPQRFRLRAGRFVRAPAR